MGKRTFESTIHTDFGKGLTYSRYLQLDKILGAQSTLTEPPHHDETLFIIQHQTSELWMKLIIHELAAAVAHIRHDELEPCFKILSRIKLIQRQLFDQWSVLETLTPTEYAQFRSSLGRASGFQSYQYRMIEFLFGNKDPDAIRVFVHDPAIHAPLKDALESPSVYDEFLMHLGRRGMPVPGACTDRDFSQPYEPNADLIPVFKAIYENPGAHWDAYEMCEKLVDVDEAMSLWRFRHMKTVERIIGFKTGTGGSSGVPFLRQVVETRLFPELWDVRTQIEDVEPPARSGA